MPCIFCIATIAMLAGAITTNALDQLEGNLSNAAAGPVQRSVDTSSVAKFELSVPPPPELVQRVGASAAAAVPVALTVFKAHGRIRLQVLTHSLTRSEAERVEDYVAYAAGLTILSRSDAHDEAAVREAFGEQEAIPGSERPASEAQQSPRTY